MRSRFRKPFIVTFVLGAFIVGVSFASATAQFFSNQQGQSLLKYSEQFDNNVGWIKSGSSATADAAIAPNGTKGADKIVENTANSTHQTFYNNSGSGISVTGNTTYTSSVYVKAAGRSWVQLRHYDGTSNSGAYFNLSNGTIGTTSALITPSIVYVGDGWYRISITFATVSGATTERGVQLLLATADSTLTYAGDGVSGVYAWGAQVVKGSKPGAYNPTVASALNSTYVPTGTKNSNQKGQNIVTYSQQFSSWTAGSALITVTDNVIANPVDGKQNAGSLVAVAGTGYRFIRKSTFAYTSGVTYTASVYVKPTGSWSKIGIRAGQATVGNNFDLSALTCTPQSGYTCGIITVGGGWYRVWTTFTSNGSASYDNEIIMNVTESSTMTGGETIYIWGAQTVTGATPNAYNPTTSARLNSTYFQTGKVASSQLGQNLVKYSEQFDNVGWTKSFVTVTGDTQANPITAAKTADTITEDGSTSYHGVSDLVTIPTGYVTFSIYAKIASGTRYIELRPSGIGSGVAYANFDLTNGKVVTGGTGGTAYVSSSIQPFGNGWYRVSMTANYSVAPHGMYILFANSTTEVPTYAGDSTSGFYIWGAQTVAGSKPGAYNKTTSSALNPSYVP